MDGKTSPPMLAGAHAELLPAARVGNAPVLRDPENDDVGRGRRRLRGRRPESSRPDSNRRDSCKEDGAEEQEERHQKDVYAQPVNCSWNTTAGSTPIPHRRRES